MRQRAAEWHRKHPMPVRATLDERVRWHLAHARACGCRPTPRTVLAALRARRVAVPKRATGVIVALGVLGAAWQEAQAQTGSRAAEAEVAALVATYDSAWNSRDTATVSRLLAPGYQYFTSRGDLSSRVETMSTLADPGYVLRHARRSEVTVTPSGPVAIVASRWQGEGTWRGEAFTDDQRCGQAWVRAGPAWQLLSEHCVQIAPRSPG